MRTCAAIACAAAWCGAGLAGGVDPMSDGSDGALDLAQDTEIDLSQAVTASWDAPSAVPGGGVYDPDLWVVVFKYESVVLGAGVDVTFKPHPSGAPVVWLVQEDVTLKSFASIRLDGADSALGEPAPAPPGGFQGGRAAGSAGFGPGGGGLGGPGLSNDGAGASYATLGIAGADAPAGPTYGNPAILPLIGGSGGGADVDGSTSGGTGGGAILIAAGGAISITSSAHIVARGGDGTNGINAQTGAGSGGAVRLVADLVKVTGMETHILATGGVGGLDGGDGRIRIEANTVDLTGSTIEPTPIIATPGATPILPDALTPHLRITTVNSAPISLDPRAGVLTVDAPVVADPTVTVKIEAFNIAPGTQVEVTVTPAEGPSFVVLSTPLAGSMAFSTAAASFELDTTVPADIGLRIAEDRP